MTLAPSVSLVIVSRGRPEELGRLLLSLRYLTYPRLEVIVVSDKGRPDQRADLHGLDTIEFIHFDQANISAARNLGIAAARGEIVAFCDDDSVPEPTWLGHLTAPFQDGEVGAAGGFVRGRNGISFQYKASRFDRLGNRDNLELPNDQPVILEGDKTWGIKTEGTNCAFRRSALLSLGGFDENFRYYLDETDLDYRLGLAGWKTAIVPLAQVHHGHAASKIRNSRRAPRDLFEIGASKAWFLRKHAEFDEIERELSRFQDIQRRRLVEFMLKGDMEPFEVRPVLETLKRGVEDGMRRTRAGRKRIQRSGDRTFSPFPTADESLPGAVIACRLLRWPILKQHVHDLARNGTSVTVFRFSTTAITHRFRFTNDGFWLQTGGVFGRSDRQGPLVRLTTFNMRAKKEIEHLRSYRQIE